MENAGRTAWSGVCPACDVRHVRPRGFEQFLFGQQPVIQIVTVLAAGLVVQGVVPEHPHEVVELPLDHHEPVTAENRPLASRCRDCGFSREPSVSALRIRIPRQKQMQKQMQMHGVRLRPLASSYRKTATRRATRVRLATRPDTVE
jgi:hypothetical protein